MARQPTVIVRIRNLEFDGVQAHGDGEIDPSPGVAAYIAALVRPPLACHSTSVRAVTARKVLHEQTRVNSNDDARAEPCQEAEDLGCLVVIVETGLLGQRASTALPDGGDDARGGVHDEDAVGERDDDRGRDGHDGTDHEVETRVGNGGQRTQRMKQRRIGRHDDGW